MIFGGCPYEDCRELFTTALAERPPVFQKIECKKCGRCFMVLHSRIDPIGYTMEDFNKMYVVDEATKSIQKLRARPMTDEQRVANIRRWAEGLVGCNHSLCSTAEAMYEEKFGRWALDILDGKK